MSSAATLTPSRAAALAEPVAVAQQRGEVDIGVAAEGLADGQNFRLLESLGLAVAPDEVRRVPAAFAATASRSAQSSISRETGSSRAIPLQHGEFGMVQRRALAIAEDMSEGENPLLARREQLFAGEFRRGMQIKPAFVAPRPINSTPKAEICVSLPPETCSAAVSTSTKPLSGEKAAESRPRAGADLEKGLAVGVNILGPPGRSARHYWAIRDFSRRGFAARAKCWLSPAHEFATRS